MNDLSEDCWPFAVEDFVVGLGHHMGWGERVPDGHWGIWRIGNRQLVATCSTRESIAAALRLLTSKP